MHRLAKMLVVAALTVVPAWAYAITPDASLDVDHMEFETLPSGESRIVSVMMDGSRITTDEWLDRLLGDTDLVDDQVAAGSSLVRNEEHPMLALLILGAIAWFFYRMVNGPRQRERTRDEMIDDLKRVADQRENEGDEPDGTANDRCSGT